MSVFSMLKNNPICWCPVITFLKLKFTTNYHAQLSKPHVNVKKIKTLIFNIHINCPWLIIFNIHINCPWSIPHKLFYNKNSIKSCMLLNFPIVTHFILCSRWQEKGTITRWYSYENAPKIRKYTFFALFIWHIWHFYSWQQY